MEAKEVPYCSGVQELSVSGMDMSVAFTDGSAADTRYANSSECYWLVSTSEGDRIRLSFDRFETERYFDYVTVRVISAQCVWACCGKQVLFATVGF